MLFTPAQAAALLEVPESWLRRRAAHRQVPCTFLGNTYFNRALTIAQDIDAAHRQAHALAG